VHAVGIVAAAGSGLRLGADLPKALVPLAGRPLVAWSVDVLRAGGVTEIVVAVPAEQRAAFAAALPSDVRLVDGGASRTASVRVALAAASAGADVVLVHDAARPLTPPGMVRRVLAALAARREPLGVRGVVYFGWRDAPGVYAGGRDFFGLHTGLLRRGGSAKPALDSYRRVAESLQASPG
jgi:CTP:molybdopterin cytidylyltransferase MocA